MSMTKPIFKINTPYWSAYQRYHWEKGMWGVGLDLRRLKRAKEAGIKQIIVKTYGKTYQVSMRSLTRLFRSQRPVEYKKGTPLLVVPAKLLRS